MSDNEGQKTVTVAERCPACYEVFEHEVEEIALPPSPLKELGILSERIPEAKRLCPRCRNRKTGAGPVMTQSWGDRVLGTVFVASLTIMMLAVAIWFFRWLVGV